jgi:hypothetical protein
MHGRIGKEGRQDGLHRLQLDQQPRDVLLEIGGVKLML